MNGEGKKVLLLLAQGFEAYEASVFSDVLGWSQIVGDQPVRVVTAARRKVLQCTWNFRVIPEVQIDQIDINDYHALAMPGGFQRAGFFEDAYHESFLELIRGFYESDKIIASVCVAALALGKSGILEGRRATTYHLMKGVLRKRLERFGADVQDAPWVIDKRIITSTSPATALDVAFLLLELLTTRSNGKTVKQAMGYEEC